MRGLLDDVFPVPCSPARELGRDAGHNVRIAGQREGGGLRVLVVQPEIFFGLGLGLGHARHLRGDLQLLVVLGLVVVVLDLDGGLDALPRAWVCVADAAGGVLRSGRSRVQLVLGVAAAAADDGQYRIFLLVVLLVEKHDQIVGGFQRDPRLMAELGEKSDVTLLVLLHATVERVAVGKVHTGHAVGCGHLVRNAGKCVGLPRLGLFRLADLCAVRQRRRLDGDGVGRAGGVNTVQLELAAVQHLIPTAACPVLPDENGTDLEAGAGSGRGGGSAAAPAAGFFDVRCADIGGLAVVADLRPAVFDTLDLQLCAADQRAVFAVAGAGAGADIQAAFGCDLVGLCCALGLGLGGRGQAPCGGCRVDGVGQPLLEPDVIAVLKLQLQVVGFVCLFVGVCSRQEIGAHTAGDVRALEEDLRRDAASLIRATHPTTCFHGGMASLTSSTGSGSFSTIPAGKV